MRRPASVPHTRAGASGHAWFPAFIERQVAKAAAAPAAAPAQAAASISFNNHIHDALAANYKASGAVE